MKTPRELLLNEHRDARARLDWIRRNVVGSLNQTAEGARAERRQIAGFLSTCWQELFASCRQWWAGLGVAWCLVLLFVALGAFEPWPGSEVAVAKSEPAFEALQERRQLQDELLGIAANHPGHDSRSPLGPRSGIRLEERYV